MAYNFWAFDLVSKTPYGQLPLVGAQLATLINTPGAFQANLYPESIIPESWGIGSMQDALSDPRVVSRLQWLKQAIECGKTLVIAEYNGTVAGSAIVWQWTYNSEDNSTGGGSGAYYALQGSETISYFQQRNYRGATGAATDAVNSGFNVNFAAGVDQVSGTIKAILDYAQQGFGNIGIGTDRLVPSNVSNQESYDPTKRDSLFTLLSNLAATIDGPDFWVDTQWAAPGNRTPVLEMVAGYPKLGSRWDGTTDGLRKLPHFSYPGEILNYQENRYGTQCYTVLDEMSADSTGLVTIATANNSGLSQAGKWPQLDFAYSRDGGEAQAVSQATLQQYVNADAQQYNGPLDLLTVMMRPGDVVGKLFPGDDAWFSIKDWNYPTGTNSVQRCLGVQYDFDNETAQIQIDTNDGGPAIGDGN